MSLLKHFGRNFSTSALRCQVAARPLISGERKQVERLATPPRLNFENVTRPELERLRVVPTLSTFYGGNPVHEANINKLNQVIRRNINLPTKVLDKDQLEQYRFLTFEEYAERCQSGLRLKKRHYKEVLGLLHRLRSIDPQLMPTDAAEMLNSYETSRVVVDKVTTKKLKQLDQWGRANAVGRRKSSKASVQMVRGEGQVIVNGKSLFSYFPKDTDRKKIAYPFQVVNQEGKYNIFARVSGGGSTGQIEAIMYGIAKCLVIHNPLFKPRLSKAGLMTRDTRIVERKKPGKVKARKSPTWVKR